MSIIKKVGYPLAIVVALATGFVIYKYTAKSDPEELFETYSKSVVMIKNEYVYVAKLRNSKNTELYFTDVEAGEFKNMEVGSMEKVPTKTSYGTGFIISKDGKIATNRHVAAPAIDNAQQLLDVLKTRYEAKRPAYMDTLTLCGQRIRELQDLADRHGDNLDEATRQRIRERIAYWEQKRRIANEVLSIMDFNPKNASIEAKIINLGIVYENTHITEKTDYEECVLLQVAKDKADLAVIQLTDKSLPESVKNIFEVPENDGKKEEGYKLKLNTDLYMIGYNYASVIGDSDGEGLTAQLTQGKLSQKPKKFKFLHSIPTLSGSSGSPVLDENGTLVGVNFAGIGSQSFNYAVPVKNLRKLLDE